jgi:hypothetical protein
MARDLETAIGPTAGGEPIAWFPDALGSINTHPSGRLWTGGVANHQHVIELEGEPRPIRCGTENP